MPALPEPAALRRRWRSTMVGPQPPQTRRSGRPVMEDKTSCGKRRGSPAARNHQTRQRSSGTTDLPDNVVSAHRTSAAGRLRTIATAAARRNRGHRIAPRQATLRRQVRNRRLGSPITPLPQPFHNTGFPGGDLGPQPDHPLMRTLGQQPPTLCSTQGPNRLVRKKDFTRVMIRIIVMFISC